jgi:exodeoxyribonuclease X
VTALDDFAALGARAGMQGGYWLSGDEPPVRTRENLYLTFQGEWILGGHGQAKEYVKIIHVLDVETTGLKAEEGDVAIELAVVLLGVRPNGSVVIQQHGARSFVNPRGRAIAPQASGVHHIIDRDIEDDTPGLHKVVDLVLQPFGLGGVNICAAHNCDFDRGFLPMLAERRWIDTLQCARHVWPDAPDHRNQTLRYWLGVDLPRDGAHRALEDAMVTAHILARLLAERTVDELLALTMTPVLLRKVDFGKHHGQLWTEVPTDYLFWVLRTAAQNAAEKAAGRPVGSGRLDHPDVISTVHTELARRRLSV